MHSAYSSHAPQSPSCSYHIWTPWLPENEDDRIRAQGNRTSEKDAQLRINFHDRDFVGSCHLTEGGLDLPIYCEKSFRDSLSGDPKARSDSYF